MLKRNVRRVNYRHLTILVYAHGEGKIISYVGKSLLRQLRQTLAVPDLHFLAIDYTTLDEVL